MGKYTDRLKSRNLQKKRPSYERKNNECEYITACAIMRGEETHHGFRSHSELRRSLGDKYPSNPLPGDFEGFWTSEDRFVSRETANIITAESGQCVRMRRDMLSSDIDWWTR